MLTRTMIRVITLSIILMIACISCESNSNGEPATTTTFTDSSNQGKSANTVLKYNNIEKDTTWDSFVSLFGDTTTETLQLYMHEAWIEKIDQEVHYSISKKKFSENLAFKGKIIDQKWNRIVRQKEMDEQQQTEYYACYRIPFDSSFNVFLIRIYSKSAPQTVDFLYLYVFDLNKHLVDKLRVAELTGDDATSAQLQSWILDLDGNGRKEVLSRYNVTNYDGEKEEKIVTLKVMQLDSLGKFKEVKTLEKPLLKKVFQLKGNGAVYH